MGLPDSVGQEGWQATMNTAQQQALQITFNMQCNALDNGFGDYVDPTTVLLISAKVHLSHFGRGHEAPSAQQDAGPHDCRGVLREGCLYKLDAFFDSIPYRQCQMTHRSYNTLECEDAPVSLSACAKRPRQRWMPTTRGGCSGFHCWRGRCPGFYCRHGWCSDFHCWRGGAQASTVATGGSSFHCWRGRCPGGFHCRHGRCSSFHCRHGGAQASTVAMACARDANTSGIYSSDDEAAGSRRFPGARTMPHHPSFTTHANSITSIYYRFIEWTSCNSCPWFGFSQKEEGGRH